ncbi:hypothetical protein ACFL0V_05375, partial [Nanoarchaeota archaeon]
MILILVVVLSLYLYLPIRSQQDPIMDWGNPETLDNLIYHVTGQQYSGYLSLSIQSISNILTIFIQLNILLGFVILGFLQRKLLNKRLFHLLLITALTFFVFSLFYGISDIMAYYSPIFLFLIIFAGLGIDLLTKRFRSILIPVIA